MYDVIVVGTRVAGASTAMLLARRGLKVLHQVQVPGAAALKRWGLLDRVEAAGTPATRRVRFDAGAVVLEGHWPAVDAVDALYSPRRTILDAILVDAAREAGAEIREHVAVDEIVSEGGRVTGIRGRERGGPPLRESARFVVGADGRHSLVAKSVCAAAYHVMPPLSVAYYTYVPVGTVRSRLSAARAKLAAELLDTAAAAHMDTQAYGRRALEYGAAMQAFERSGDSAPLRGLLAPDVAFVLFDRVQRRGLEAYAARLRADFEDGVRSRHIRTIAGADLAVTELRLDSPPDRPLHCPPAMTQISFHDGNVTRRIATHYAAIAAS